MAQKITKNQIAAQEAWITPTLTNSWVNYALGYENTAYMKDSLGFVHVRGLVKGGTLNAQIFLLPAGYRPTGTLIFLQGSGDGYSRIDVASSGSVSINGGAAGAQSYLALNFTFKAEQ